MMRKRGHNRRKLNNKGLSLIEVLVAMLILSIASIALLRSFSYAVQLNTKSKENQQAMVLAQSFMESLKAYDVDGLDAQFDPTASFTLYPLSGGEVRSKSGTGLDARTYRLDNVVHSGNAYDVLINMTPRAALVKDLATYTSPNRHSDAFFQQEYEEKQKLYDGILARLQSVHGADPANTMVVNTSRIKIHSRQMKLVITDNTVNYYVTYEYSLLNYDIVKNDATIDQITENNITYTIDYATDFTNVQKYDNTDPDMQTNGVVLENIYLYYYPNYKSISNPPYVMPCDSDELLIQNSSSSVKNVYVIRQKDTSITDATLVIGESDYKLKVDNSTTQFVNLYHNIQDSLTDSGSPDFRGTPTNVTDMGSPWQASTETTNLLYDVTVTVNEQGTSDEVCSLVGTTNVQ